VFIWKGSLKGVWRISYSGKYWEHANKWTPEIGEKLTGLGFVDFDGKPLHRFSGNGGMFQVFVRGHNELLKEVTL